MKKKNTNKKISKHQSTGINKKISNHQNVDINKKASKHQNTGINKKTSSCQNNGTNSRELNCKNSSKNKNDFAKKKSNANNSFYKEEKQKIQKQNNTGNNLKIQENVSSKVHGQNHKKITSNQNAQNHKKITSKQNAQNHKKISSKQKVESNKKISSNQNAQNHKKITSKQNAQNHKRISSNPNVQNHKKTSQKPNAQNHKNISSKSYAQNRKNNIEENINTKYRNNFDEQSSLNRTDETYKKDIAQYSNAANRYFFQTKPENEEQPAKHWTQLNREYRLARQGLPPDAGYIEIPRIMELLSKVEGFGDEYLLFEGPCGDPKYPDKNEFWNSFIKWIKKVCEEYKKEENYEEKGEYLLGQDLILNAERRNIHDLYCYISMNWVGFRNAFLRQEDCPEIVIDVVRGLLANKMTEKQMWGTVEDRCPGGTVIVFDKEFMPKEGEDTGTIKFEYRPNFMEERMERMKRSNGLI